MNYTRSLKFLDSFLNLEKLSEFPKNSFFNLKRMEHLLRISGRPDKNFSSILIAGTTGKGSTGFFLESILRTNNIKTGFYHSPHVEDVRERIRIGGRMASRKLWAEGLTAIRRLLEKHPLPAGLGALTYFEVMTFLAILLFSRTEQQVGIFEIGLGGRLDATNVLKAPLVILTPIHLDHEHFLGNTIGKIALEKAAIIKKGCSVVSVPQTPEAGAVIRKAVHAQGARLFESEPYRGGKIGLSGDFQMINAGAAIQAARILRFIHGYRIDPSTYSRALRSRSWTGRMELFRKFGRTFILDGAHNPFSSAALARSLRHPFTHRMCENGTVAHTGCVQRSWLIFGAMKDKNSRAMLAALAGRFGKIIVTRIRNHRAKSIGTLLGEAKDLFKCVLPARNTEEAIRLSKEVSEPGQTIVVTGSFYLVGEARRILAQRKGNSLTVVRD